MLPAFSFILLHSKMGMEREYLSDDFWRKWSSWLKPPKERGYVWLYDEYNWPSGVVGGKLLREHPEFMQRYLDYTIATAKRGGWLK